MLCMLRCVCPYHDSAMAGTGFIKPPERWALQFTTLFFCLRRSSPSPPATCCSTTALSRCSMVRGTQTWCGSWPRESKRLSTGMTLTAALSCASGLPRASGTGQEPLRQVLPYTVAIRCHSMQHHLASHSQKQHCCLCRPCNSNLQSVFALPSA